LTTPVLVPNHEKSIPQCLVLAILRQIAKSVEARLIPSSNHVLGDDKPARLTDRLVRFLL